MCPPREGPEIAIRHGFNLAERLTQFIEPPAASAPDPDTDDDTTVAPDAERLRSSWGDLWRQLGARPDPLRRAEAGLPPARLLAFYIVRQNQTRTWGATRQVPIAVLMDPDGTNIQFTDRRGPRMQELTSAGGDEEGGRGLSLVAGLAKRWG